MKGSTARGLTVLLALVVACMACAYAAVQKDQYQTLSEAVQKHTPYIEAKRVRGDVILRVDRKHIYDIRGICGPTT